MKNTRLFILTLLLTFGSLISQAQQIIKLSLRDAIEIMLDKNFDIQIERKNMESARLDLGIGVAGFLPTIDLGATQNNRYENSKASVTQNSRDESMANGIRTYMELTWTIFDGFAARIRRDRYTLIANLSEGNVALVIENKIQAVVLAYYQVLLNAEKLKTISEIKAISHNNYKYLLSKQSEANTSSYYLLQAQNAFLSDSVYCFQQQLELKRAFLKLNLLLGVDKSSKFALTDDYKAAAKNLNLSLIEEKMLSNNKTLVNQYINLEILKKNTKFSRTPLYPSLRFSGGGDFSNTAMLYQGLTRNINYSFDYYADFSLSFNLFNGGNTRSAIKNAKIKEAIGLLQIDQIKQSLSNELITLVETYNIQKQLLAVTEEYFEKAKLNMDLSNEKFKSGEINSFNYRDVQSDYLNAAFSKLQAVYDLLDTNTEIVRLSGGIISEYE